MPANPVITDAMQDLADYMAESLADYLPKVEFQKDELCMTIAPDYLIKAMTILRDNKEMQFQQLIDITAVDYPARAERFEIVYHLLSVRHNHRVRVKSPIQDGALMPSVTGLYSTAGWLEREVFDMYGVAFSDHPDMRRILTDYGFEGHPLRKDFPLTGYVELRYDEEQKRVVYEPVTLQQDFRKFDNLSPWEGMTDVMLPGDEKAAIPEHGVRAQEVDA